MALNIKDPATDRLARELSEETGESITEATRKAIDERLTRVRARSVGRPQRDALQAIIERGRARDTCDERAPEEIIDYDEHGLPR